MREDLPPEAKLLEPDRALGRGPRALALARLLAVLSCAGGFHAGLAAHAQPGTLVEDRVLATIDGGRERLVEDGAANVLVFVRPEHERSARLLKDLAACRAPLAGKPVRWAAIVSGSASAESTRGLVRDSGLAIPVLLDDGDAVYGALGVALHPVIVIVRGDRTLAAFEPFRAIDYCAVVTARIRHVLGEIRDDELERALSPPPAADGGDATVARRYRALAEALFKARNYDKALHYVRMSLDRDPALAAAHALMGAIFAAQGDCAAALPAYRSALALDPANVRAKDGLGRCAK